MRTRSIRAAAASLAVLALSLAACTVEEEAPSGNDNNGGDSGVQEQEYREDLFEQLPEEIQESGTITAVNTGSFPPYTEVDGDGNVTGATADMGKALGEVLGLEIQHETVDGLSGALVGIEAGRYDLHLGPVGDFPDRQEQATFVDWVQEFVVFAVPAGNPNDISDVTTVCGLSIAVQAGGSAEEVIRTQSDACIEDGEDAIDVNSFKDQPSAVLSVQSGRTDAFFSSQAPLTYFVEDSDGELELAGVGEPNGFDDLYQGLLVPVDSPMADVFLEAIEVLHENGTYEQIMTARGLEGNMLDEPGINLAE